MIIQVDSREQKNKEVLDYFQKIGQKYFVSKMYSADYCNYDNPKILIDLKKDLVEVASNLTKDHERFKREIERAVELGCELVVLIRESITFDSIKQWESPKRKNGKALTQVKGEVLYKIMNTMKEKYKIRWEFCTRQDAGQRIIEILGR